MPKHKIGIVSRGKNLLNSEQPGKRSINNAKWTRIVWLYPELEELFDVAYRCWRVGSGASNRRYKMENADNLNVEPSARPIETAREWTEREKKRERERRAGWGRWNNLECYFIRCHAAVDAQSFHKRCSWARWTCASLYFLSSPPLSSPLSFFSSDLARELFRFLSRSQHAADNG